MWLGSFLNARRERCERIEREATTLLTFLGEMAYPVARDRARACRETGDRAGDRLWSRVAVTIAQRTDREIGVKVADRYQRSPRQQANCEELRRFQAINLALAGLARGTQAPTELHNLEAHVLNALDLAKAGPDTRAAAVEFILAATELAGEPEACRASLAQGQYPPLLEAAGHALERFRAAVIAPNR